MAFCNQNTANRKQRIEMSCCGRRSNKNFHAILSFWLAKSAVTARSAAQAIGSSRKETRGSLLRLDFGAERSGYGCNARWLCEGTKVRAGCVSLSFIEPARLIDGTRPFFGKK